MMNLLLFVMLTTCAATPRDLSGKMFTFPEQNKRAYVRLTAAKQEFSAATICHRSFTDLKRDHAFFSIASLHIPNAFLVLWDELKEEIEIHINDMDEEFKGLDYKRNVWHSICSTWDSTSGVVQLWFDGQPSIRRYVTVGSTIKRSTIIILGQEQHSYGGDFQFSKSFVGMLSDVHMWDYMLSPCEIQDYVDGLNFTPGNVLNWQSLEFEITGRVLIENKLQTCY